MQANDFKGLYGIIPTPARAGSAKLNAKNTVDLDESERLIKNLIRDGVSGLIVLGTTGECATLSTADYRAFVDLVCKTANNKIPVFVGATALGGHEVFDRLSFVKEQGGTGTLLGLPMWQPCTNDMAVRFYSEVAELFPKLPIMVYANTRAFRFPFSTDFWTGVSQSAPTVVSAKSSHANGLVENISSTGGRIHFMPSDMVVSKFFDLSPRTTTSCWATAAGMGPEPSKKIIDAILADDKGVIAHMSEKIAWCNAPLEPILKNAEVFASYNIQVEKIRMQESGYCNPGPSRPPYDVIPADFAEAAKECGRRWKQLRAEIGALNS